TAMGLRPGAFEHGDPEHNFPSPAESCATIAKKLSDPQHNVAVGGKGSSIVGKLTFEGSARIGGHVEGQIFARDQLTSCEGAIVNAQIVADSVVIQGRVNGDVTAYKHLELRAPARLYGNVQTPSFVLEEGTVFQGVRVAEIAWEHPLQEDRPPDRK